MGYYRTRSRRSKYGNPRAARYNAYKRRVRLVANCAGVPGGLPDGYTASVSVYAIWKRKPRIDTDSVFKAVPDALWSQDRRVTEIYAVSKGHCNVEEYAEVVVKIYG